MDGEIEVVAVETAGKKTYDLKFIHILLELGVCAVGFSEEFFIFRRKFQHGGIVFDRTFQFAERFQNVAAAGKRADRRLGGFLVVPEVRSGHFRFKRCQLLAAFVDFQKAVQMGDAFRQFTGSVFKFIDSHHFCAALNFHISSRRRWMSSRHAPQAPPALQ